MSEIEGNLQQLERQLKHLGFNTSIMLALSLIVHFGKPDGDFLITVVKDIPAGRMVYYLDFGLNVSGNIELMEYQALLMKKVHIEHTTVEEINTKELDEEMKRIDWSIDYKRLENDSSEMTLARSKQIEDMKRLIGQLQKLSRNDSAGKQIADMLKAKYFLFTPYEEHYVPQRIKSQYVKERIFSVKGVKGITATEAQNILRGHAVRKTYLNSKGELQTEWFKMREQGGFPEYPQEHFFSGQYRYPDFDLRAVLNSLSIVLPAERNFDEVLTSLRQGNLQQIPMTRNGKIEPLHLLANPETKDVDIFDEAGNKVNRSECLSPLANHQKNKTDPKKNKGRRNKL